jgi:phosphohistidine phosphatase SixA
MNRRSSISTVLAAALATGWLLLPLNGAQAETPMGTGDWASIKPGTVVLFRHATAPGTGDPPQFKLDDCSTQRNLDDTGRAQARRLGEVFRSRGIRVTAVLSSQWCRARDTADLAFPNLRQDDPSFNSFFQDRTRSDPQTAAAKARLLKHEGPGVMVVVAHQVNITAITGVVPASGEGVVLQRRGRELVVVGRVMP